MIRARKDEERRQFSPERRQNSPVGARSKPSILGSRIINSSKPTSTSSSSNVLASWASEFNALKNRRSSKYRKFKDDESGGLWTVQIPKRMLLSTLGVFLVIPLTLFLWKEMHVTNEGGASDQLRGGAGHAQLKTKNRFVTWMEDGVPEDEYNTTAATLEAGNKREQDVIANDTQIEMDHNGHETLEDLLKEKELLDKKIQKKVVETIKDTDTTASEGLKAMHAILPRSPKTRDADDPDQLPKNNDAVEEAIDEGEQRRKELLKSQTEKTKGRLHLVGPKAKASTDAGKNEGLPGAVRDDDGFPAATPDDDSTDGKV